MLTRLLLAGMLAGGAMGGHFAHVFGQADPATGLDWGSVLGGAIGSSPATAVLLWRLTKADKETAELRVEVNDSHAQALAMTREMAPLLTNAVETLERVKAGLESQLENPRKQEPELERILRRIERTISDLADEPGGKGRR